MIDFHQTTFIKSASQLSQCPQDEGVEIAFAGRSNAGKSSLLNTLTQQKKLARTSKTPGRTQLLNFFATDALEEFRLVDLPGYGYAKVSESVRKEWHKMLDTYLSERKSLTAIVLVMDVRHPMQPFDEQMVEWCLAGHMPLHLALTKADKLKYGAAKNTLLKVQKRFEQENIVTAQLFSSLKRQGVDQLGEYLSGWAE